MFLHVNKPVETIGADLRVADKDVSGGNPVPVSGPLTDTDSTAGI